MIQISEKNQCCGCAACVQVCPRQCIDFEEDKEGFRYPLVNEKICVDCHLCEKVCPVLNRADVKDPIEIYASYNKDENIRLKSSSGGIFTVLAENVIRQGGVVFGARFDDNWEVYHDYSETFEGLGDFRGSKYVQSRIEKSYQKVKEFLDMNRKVLFSGTPCQVAGLYRYLGKQYDNLLTVDFICHGVPSPKVWRKYLEGITRNVQQSVAGNINSQSHKIMPVIKSINFRDKRSGWKKYSFTVTLAEATDEGRDNLVSLSYIFPHVPYMNAFISDVTLRPSCYLCPSKRGRSMSDITIADWWGVIEYFDQGQIDDDKGICIVLLNSEKGLQFFNQFDVVKKLITWDEATPCNGGFKEIINVHPKRKFFFRKLDKSRSVFYLIKKTFKPSLFQRLRVFVGKIKARFCKILN